MSTEINMPDFDQIADIFWRLGVMQSPSQLQGFLVGQLVVGESLSPEDWIAQAAAYTDSVEPPNEEESRTFLELFAATAHQLKEGEMDLALLLPDDATEISLRVDALGQWSKGFLAGFVMAGKMVQESKGQQEYSPDVSEALTDMAAIAQVNLSEDDSDEELREKNYFEISEYLRLAAITLHMECSNVETPASESEKESTASSPSQADDSNINSPSGLFTSAKKKLH